MVVVGPQLHLAHVPVEWVLGGVGVAVDRDLHVELKSLPGGFTLKCNIYVYKKYSEH